MIQASLSDLFWMTECGDSLEMMKEIPDGYFDLVITSPPYENARTYGIDFDLKGEAFVEWCVERYLECRRICKGAVLWVMEGRTRDYRYSCTPILIMARLHNLGVHLRKPPIYARYGIPGGGGPDWFRNDYEFVIASGPGGRLPWSDNTAAGHPPKYGCSGGPFSNRSKDGTRTNRVQKKHAKANPGNVFRDESGIVVECGSVGSAGSEYAHENEAPFAEKLVEPLIKSLCPPGGVIFDPFLGSGTTLAVAKKLGRSGVGIDIRQSQVELAERRLQEIEPCQDPIS